MTYTYAIPSSLGEAFIATKRNRVKTYAENVYLQDKQEFEIELFNPSQNTKLARISINGKQISSSGIVLKPGQRVFLERYIDNPRKFLFETYTVDGNDSQALAAIAKNGLVEVSFYDEYVSSTYTYGNSYWDSQVKYRKSPTLGDPWNQLFTQISNSNHNNIGASYLSNSLSSTSASQTAIGQEYKARTTSLDSVKETGKVEQGAHSNQNFTNYSGSFNAYTSNVVNIKLLPFSDKPLEINELAQYCTSCGAKRKKGANFCSQCGTKF